MPGFRVASQALGGTEMHRLTRSAVMLAALFSIVSALGQARTISDEFLLRYASMEYDKGAHGEKRQTLGLLNGIEAIVEFALCQREPPSV